jgi:hypothetical protein
MELKKKKFHVFIGFPFISWYVMNLSLGFQSFLHSRASSKLTSRLGRKQLIRKMNFNIKWFKELRMII